MAVYSYKAVPAGRGDGQVQRGTITADSPRAARDALRMRGFRVRDLNETRVSRARSDTGTASKRRWTLRSNDAAVLGLFRELSTLLAAGIPLLPALDTIIRQQKGAFAAELQLLRERVAAGESLAAAMRTQPDLFDLLSISMVEIGERSGGLDTALDQLAAFRQRSHQFRGRIATALVYPVIVVATGLAVTIFLMTFVVPQLLQALVEAGIELPLMTRIVRAASDAIVAWWWLMLLAAAAVALTFAWAQTRPAFRKRTHTALLRAPLLGELIRKQAIVRIAIAMAALTRSGVEFVHALAIVRGSIGNIIIRDALKRCEDAVAAGRDIGPAIEETGVFPPTVVQVVDVGQATGKLDAMLERLAADYDAQVVVASQRLIALLEPVLILVLAVFIGFIVLSVILPYMQVGNVL